VIHLLTQSPPSLQKATIERFFTPDASFTHPFCRTGSWDLSGKKIPGETNGTPTALVGGREKIENGWNSRFLIWMIYRWYKIMSPKIILDVGSVGKHPLNPGPS
jgi:hypothetical protein